MIAGLNLPIEVPWERLCVSSDMLEPDVCSEDHLPKWRSSIAIWRYVPEDEYQIYPGRKIIYLKVSATVTGYQPREKELEGRFRGAPIIRKDVDSLLDTFYPCTGAILQVTVGPREIAGVDVNDYPFFMDFQPKKRELYEMATDTNERVSRSAEETKLGKSSGTTRSQEILDVDQGGSVGGSGGVSIAGYGAGGSSNASAQGQWGSKHLASDQLNIVRSSDESRERRETQSHTTQLSQMYNLLDSYHVGTNRAVFLISPRPHVLDEPSGLVKGPRPVDGIQEFFLIVNQPADQEHVCVSARLDTGHLTTVAILDYERRPGPPVQCSANPPLPNPEHPAAPEFQLGVLDADNDERVGTFYYACNQLTDNKTDSYTAPTGFLIEDWNELKDVAVNGSSAVEITPSGGSLTVTCNATSRRCFFRRADVDWGYQYNAPDTAGVIQGSCIREVEPLLRSITKTKHVGDRKVLLLTTRGVCCCTDGTEMHPSGVKGLATIVEGPHLIEKSIDKTKAAATQHAEGGSHTRQATAQKAIDYRFADAIGGIQVSAPDRDAPSMTARQANELGMQIREGILRLHTTASKPVPYVETDLFIYQLQQRLQQHPEGRSELEKSTGSVLSGTLQRKINKRFRREEGEPVRKDILDMPTQELAEAIGADEAAARRLKLRALGFEFSNTDPSNTEAA